MKIDRAIQLVKLERDYLYKNNDAASRELRAELVTALDMAVYALKAVKAVDKLQKFIKGSESL